MNTAGTPVQASVPAGFFVSAAAMDGGFFLIMSAMPFKVLDLGGNGLALGVTAAVGAVAYIVAAPLSGRLSDSRDRRIMTWVGALSLVSCAVAAWLVQTLALLIGLQVLMGFGKALYWPPVQATVGDLTPAAARSRVLGRFNLSWSGGKGAGFLCGGLLLARFGFQVTYLAGAACVVAALVSLPRGPSSALHLTDDPAISPDSPPPPPAPGPDAFLIMSWLANTAAYGAFGILAFHLPQYITDRGWESTHYGWFLGTVLAVQTLVFATLAGTTRPAWSIGRLWVPQVLSIAALAALPMWAGFVGLLAMAPLIGLGCGTAYQASLEASLEHPAVRGRRAGIHEGLIGAGGFLPPLVAGALVRFGLGLAAPYWLAAGLIGASLCVQFWFWKRCRPTGSGSP